MPEPTTPRRGGRAMRVAALAGATALAAALASGCSAPSDGAKTATPTGSPPSAPAPDRIEIPDIKVDARLETVGLDADGVMQEPDFAKPAEAAWYKRGPAPGEKGPATIVGHMDTPDTPEAVFFNLKKLTKDEQIKVHREDGTTVVFAVDRIETFKKDQFPTDKVYGDTDNPELRLITCGGKLTKDRHWDSNVVVFAHLTDGA